ncbi:myosin heavy chain [Plasmopara halstedii]|uniref:Myosin heavy chain n=1 Tax=Plasmopara halstedii TaxID=4781 RepID=A0A0P1B3S2_PLAHL|nr:myosin heavy chain [Plasmopara halstedii]CEG48613.1 myosin heavy chain [Plasmopara halstedii]|eukprot:XP_024584982.1 myosin heavy chain [Plasmopara halstedii]
MSTNSPPCRGSCGQQTSEAHTEDSNAWIPHAVFAANPTDKRKSELCHQQADSSRHRNSADSSTELDRTREITGNLQDSIMTRISTLRALCDEGYITEEEYERRKCVIMDELTFSSIVPILTTEKTVTQRRRTTFRRTEGLPLIVPHAPDFQELSPEVAVKHMFNYATRQWSSTQVCINLDETPFSKGSLRLVYHLQDLSTDNGSCYTGSFVAKLAIDPDEDPQTYFRDIELQAHCAHYAQVYNSYTPPKRVEFIPAWVLELPERNGALCAVEAYIPGEYRKHNNNFGSVSDDERNTPQAFSHFTYEASNHELLAVDIQGVGDMYTDPQIHTLNGHDFGKGNLGVLGFQKFLSSHRCNSICRYLKLPPVNPKSRHADSGTLPVQELMNRDCVRSTHFDSRHYYENAPMLQKYVTQCRDMDSELSFDSSCSCYRRFRKRYMNQLSDNANSCKDSFCGVWWI